MHYLDNAATTKVADEVIEAIQKALANHWGNPSSLYTIGMEAEDAIKSARKVLAKALGCKENEVFFTGGGTEGDNIAVLGAARARKGWGTHLVSTGYEHPGVEEPLAMLAKTEGFSRTVVKPAADGRVSIDELVAAVGPNTGLVAAMHVNNETGAVLDVETLAAAVKEKNSRCFVHVDGVQGFCKLPLALGKTKIDSYAASGHKLHAPKGVGALYLRGGKAANILPPMPGGGQEGGVRSGTENTAYIVGFAKAVELALQTREEDMARLEALRAALLAGLAELEGVVVHSPADAFPGTVMFSLPGGYKSEMMIHHLDDGYGVCVSSGSACSGGAASHTLAAMGVPGERVDTAIRASFCGGNTAEDVEVLLCGLREGLARRAHGRPGAR